jgi:ABC-type nitrate/sulfonate/bicarbonate transport system substrate-binding protein
MLEYTLMVKYVHASKRLALFALLLIVVAILTLASVSLSCSRGYSGALASISVGFQPGESAAEVYIALDKQFFAQNGLNVTIKDFDVGARAVDAVLSDELNIAGTAETPLVREAFEQQPISTIACANKIKDFFFLVGRRDRGIETITDLAGKRIGVPSQTIGDFYISRFLELHGLNTSRVTVVNVPPAQALEAIMNGSVDAIANNQPYIEAIINQLGTNAVSWNIQTDQPLFGIFVGKNDWISQNPELIRRFLNSIEQANEYIVNHPAEAKSVLQKRFGYTDAYLALVWPEHNFSLSLDQSLILAMEDEARWMISNNLTTEKTVPNFLNYISEDALKAVKPEAVKITR